MNTYQLSRSWFDFAFENPDKIKPHHSAIYFFAIEHCNRLGWKQKFGFPTSMVLDAIGMRSYSSYKKHFDELVDFGFIKVIEYSKNQYSSNIIELMYNDKALDKALDKAFIKHDTKQTQSTEQSIDSIDKPITSNKEQIKPINKEPKVALPFDSKDFLKNWDIWKEYKKKEHGFKYKSVTGEQAAILKLNKLANGNELNAIEIINQSLANGWKGFFELKNDNNGKERNSNQRKTTLNPNSEDDIAWLSRTHKPGME